MAMLTTDINTPERRGNYIKLLVEANTVIYGGALVALNASGYAVPGTEATGLRAIGRAEERAVNLGVAGAAMVKVKHGIFLWDNSTGADSITKKDIGADCYIVDDHTVALTDGSTLAGGGVEATRSKAGRVFDIDDQGVWVEV